MKKWMIAGLNFSLCFFSAGRCEAGMPASSSYERNIKKFCHRAEGLLELKGDEKLLDLSGYAPVDLSMGPCDAAIARFPEDPLKALESLRGSLKPGGKALFIFYSNDMCEISEGPCSLTSMEHFRRRAKELEFSICHSERVGHWAYFEDLSEANEFVSKYLNFSKLKLPTYAFSENRIRIPSKLIVILLKAPSEARE